MPGGFCGAGLLYAGISLRLVGRAGLADYLRLLRSPALAAVTPDPARQFNVGALLANMGISSPTLTLVLCAAVALVCLAAAANRGTEELFLLIPAASLSIAPHALYYDPALLLLPLWIAVSHAEWPAFRNLAAALITPFVFVAAGLPRPWTALASAGLFLFVFAGIAVCLRQVLPGRLSVGRFGAVPVTLE